MAVAGMYRRTLPSPPAIVFASPEGKALFKEALESGGMNGFFELISHFQTQAEPAFCGLASLAVVLNALAVDPGRTWKGPWRWFDETMLDCCEPLQKIALEGTTFSSVACLARCAGGLVQEARASNSSLADLRATVIQTSTSCDSHIIAAYGRKKFLQTGDGHFSPLGGYHRAKDLVLILDVARFKYPPHWIPVSMLWEAMSTIDGKTGLTRGFMVISKPAKAPSILFTLSCKDERWARLSIYFVQQLPAILLDGNLKTPQAVIARILDSVPAGTEAFIVWIASLEPKLEDSSLAAKTSESAAQLLVYVSLWSKASNRTLPSDMEGGPGFTGHRASPSSSQPAGTNSIVDVAVRLDAAGTSMPPRGDGGALQVTAHTSLDTSLHVSCTASAIPTQEDLLTMLILACPKDTWDNLADASARDDIHQLVSFEQLPPGLREEVAKTDAWLQANRAQISWFVIYRGSFSSYLRSAPYQVFEVFAYGSDSLRYHALYNLEVRVFIGNAASTSQRILEHIVRETLTN
eukprot:SM000044S16059  [mRNA]  locus=s44:744219:747633:- [translate_table: standard]